MSTKKNFFIFDENCCCQNCQKKCHCCHHACWCQTFFCEPFDCDKTCPKPKPKPPHPSPDPPKPKPDKCCFPLGVGIQAILQNSEAPIIEAGENIKFDTILHHVGGGIDYDEKAGIFTLKKPGNYRINWQVIIGGTHAKRFVSFGVKLDDNPYHTFPLPVTTGLLTSELILTTKKPNATITLFNDTEDRVRLSRHLPNANLVITSF